jgi:hypothetical protein
MHLLARGCEESNISEHNHFVVLSPKEEELSDLTLRRFLVKSPPVYSKLSQSSL